MAAISAIDAAATPGPFAAAITTLSADDTITFNAARKQLLVLRNTTGGSLTCTVDGDGTTVNVQGIGSVDVSAGKAIVVAAGASVAVVLGTISHYCQGVVHLKGAANLTAQLFDL